MLSIQANLKPLQPENVTTENKHIYILVRTSTDKGLEMANKAQDMIEVNAEASNQYIGPGFDQQQLGFAKKMLAAAVPAGLVQAKTSNADNLKPGTVLLKSGY